MVKTHSLLHIEDGVSTGLTLFSRFHPSECRREVKKKKKENNKKQRGQGRKRLVWGRLAVVVCKMGSTGAGCVLENLGRWSFVDVWESAGS